MWEWVRTTGPSSTETAARVPPIPPRTTRCASSDHPQVGGIRARIGRGEKAVDPGDPAVRHKRGAEPERFEGRYALLRDRQIGRSCGHGQDPTGAWRHGTPRDEPAAADPGQVGGH